MGEEFLVEEFLLQGLLESIPCIQLVPSTVSPDGPLYLLTGHSAYVPVEHIQCKKILSQKTIITLTCSSSCSLALTATLTLSQVPLCHSRSNPHALADLPLEFFLSTSTHTHTITSLPQTAHLSVPPSFSEFLSQANSQ